MDFGHGHSQTNRNFAEYMHWNSVCRRSQKEKKNVKQKIKVLRDNRKISLNRERDKYLIRVYSFPPIFKLVRIAIKTEGAWVKVYVY